MKLQKYQAGGSSRLQHEVFNEDPGVVQRQRMLPRTLPHEIFKMFPDVCDEGKIPTSENGDNQEEGKED